MGMASGSPPFTRCVTARAGWWPCLGADRHASDLQAAARERLRSTLLSGFAAAAVAVLLSFFLARSVTRPLKLMAESTAEIAAGNLGICLNIHSRDEVENWRLRSTRW